METEAPTPAPKGLWGGKKLAVVLSLAVIVLGLVGLLWFISGRDSIEHSVSVTFLGYTNIYTSEVPSLSLLSAVDFEIPNVANVGRQHRLACFRITNRSRFILSCGERDAAVEQHGNWIQETNLSFWNWFSITNQGRFILPHEIQETNVFLGYEYRDQVIQAGRSETIKVVAPSSGTRWRNSFCVTPKMSPWKMQLWLFIDRNSLGKPGAWIQRRMLEPQSRIVTSETLKL